MKNRLIREKEVLRLTGLTASTLARLERAKNFPSRTRITTRTVAWSEEEVLDWVEQQINKRRGQDV